ncbi:MAG: hypothetical protein KatS3mg096_214 [Candidatus Parcubacteria bacterium]|nr:MAG: hypothetical protein KatS3mg096_214 [Candidatus Parcubacteria bacterium]
MKGFTLIEIALVVLITTLLTGFAFKFTSFSEDTLYLKNFIYKLGSNVNLIKDFSLSRREIYGSKVCGYGILFSNNNYLAYVFATSSHVSCDLIASTTPIVYAPSSPFLYLHTNGEIRTDPISPLQIKDNFKTALSLRISLSNNCPDNLLNFYSQIALVYYNPYGDLLLLGQSAGNWVNLLPPNWQNIYFCLQYKNENRYLRLNRSGQMLIL